MMDSNITTRIVARNLGVSEDIIRMVVGEYVKVNLVQMIFCGSAETPFGEMTLRGNHVYVDTPSPLLKAMITREPGDEELREFIARKIAS